MTFLEAIIAEANSDLRNQSRELFAEVVTPHGILSEEIRNRVASQLESYNGFSIHSTSEGIIIGFDRLKFLKQWWWKGGYLTKVGQKSNDWVDATSHKKGIAWGNINDTNQALQAKVHGKVIEWGWYNHRTIEVVWKIRNHIAKSLKRNGYILFRVNAFGDHTHPLGYYVWEVREKNISPISNK